MDEKKHKHEDEDPLEAMQEDTDRELERAYEDFEAVLEGERRKKQKKEHPPGDRGV